MIKNNLEKIRLNLGYKFAKDFASFLDVKYVSYIQWETHTVQISLDKLVQIWRKLRETNPQISIHDILNLKEDD